MNNYKLVAVLLVSLIIVGCSDDPNDNERYTEYVPMELSVDEATILGKQTDISMRLIHAVNELSEGKNYVFSPLSAFRNVVVLTNGAVGQSQLSLLADMGFPESAEISDVNDFQRKLSDHLTTVDPSSKISIAESLWCGSKVSDTFKNSVTPYYDVYFGTLTNDVTANKNSINDWVRNATGGMIDNYLSQGPRVSEVILYDALYFNARWGSTPEKGKEAGKFRNASGEKVKVNQFIFDNAMELVEDHLMALRSAYGNGAYSMTFVLPDEGYTPYDAISSLNEDKWHEWQEAFVWKNTYGYLSSDIEFKYVNGYMGSMELTVPEWDMAHSIDLAPVYKKAGIGRIFSPETDFSSILGYPVSFNVADQTIRLKTTHRGTEAASVSSIKGDTAYISPKVVIDRPFAFIISEKASGAILFVGVVNNLTGI